MAMARRLRRARSPRGAVLVEAALILPLLVFLFAGIIEYGVAWRSSNTVATAVGAASQSSARNIGDRYTDINAIQQIRDTFSSSQLSNIRYVMIYRTADAGGAPPTACTTAANALANNATSSTGVQDNCNIYPGAALAGYTDTQFSASDCANEPDRWFCPVNRRTVITSFDRIGVSIRYFSPWKLKILPGTGVTINDRAVTIVPVF